VKGTNVPNERNFRKFQVKGTNVSSERNFGKFQMKEKLTFFIKYISVKTA
jgi:hypothetical protein